MHFLKQLCSTSYTSFKNGLSLLQIPVQSCYQKPLSTSGNVIKFYGGRKLLRVLSSVVHIKFTYYTYPNQF